MAGFQVMKQRGDRQLLVGLEVTVVVNRIVDDSQEGIGVNIVVFTRLLYRLVSKTKANTKTAKHLQQIIIIADQGYHLVIRLIHLLILHRCMYLVTIIGCKGRHSFRYVQ